MVNEKKGKEIVSNILKNVSSIKESDFYNV